MATRTAAEIDAEVEGRTILDGFIDTVTAHGDKVALRWMEGDDWKSMRFSELAAKVAAVAGALKDLGVSPGDRVVLMLRNVWQFHVADLAVLACNATPVSIYNSSSPEQVQYLVSHSGASVGIVEDAAFYERFAAVRDQLPNLRTIVVVDDPSGVAGDAPTWDDMLGHAPIDLAEAAAAAEPDDLATIIYTSGTTGNPKGVMLDHHNVMWTMSSLIESFEMGDDMAGKKVVSYLPMAHIAERAVSHYSLALIGYEISCCPDPSLLTAYLGEVRPNIMFGVPRVWEKIYAGVTAALSADPEKAQQVADAVEAAIPISEAMTWGTATQEQIETYEFLDGVAFSTIRGLVGLDEVELAVTGAAPIPPDLIRWFRAIGVPLAEVYGLSETCGPMTFAARRVKPGSVGPAIPGVEVAIADDGEVISRGSNNFRGYLDDPEKTAEVLIDGWFHSGDIGELDEDGYLRIVDRKKELIITAGGKNVSPANLEAALKTIPLVGQACAVGDNQPFIGALVVLDAEVAPAWAQNNGLGDKSLAELAEEPAVIAEIERGLADAMSDFNNAERVKKVRVLADEWMPDSELLTPTSKLKRRGIHATFADEIEALYS